MKEHELMIDGVTVLDYFAAFALQGLITSGINLRREEIARRSYAYARAIMEERKNVLQTGDHGGQVNLQQQVLQKEDSGTVQDFNI